MKNKYGVFKAVVNWKVMIAPIDSFLTLSKNETRFKSEILHI